MPHRQTVPARSPAGWKRFSSVGAKFFEIERILRLCDKNYGHRVMGSRQPGELEALVVSGQAMREAIERRETRIRDRAGGERTRWKQKGAG